MKIFVNKKIIIFFSARRYMIDFGRGNIKYFYIKNQYHNLHRKIGPAEIFDNNIYYWHLNNVVHRTNGSFTNDIKHWADSNRWKYKDKYSNEETYWNK